MTNTATQCYAHPQRKSGRLVIPLEYGVHWVLVTVRPCGLVRVWFRGGEVARGQIEFGRVSWQHGPDGEFPAGLAEICGQAVTQAVFHAHTPEADVPQLSLL